ncbi:phospholipid-binding protein [Xenophilus sp. AP218F]|nr:phospholipid-binding protein [Xenophilus sp. AP218F]
MQLYSDSFQHGQRIPGEFAFAVPAKVGHIALSSNRNPHLAWRDPPPGTRSFALLCHDPDAPACADDVNQEGRELPADLPRADFYHWVLLDIPGDCRGIAAGSHSDGVTARGKPGPESVGGGRHGLNDYSLWFAGDADMDGRYYGYDGPCPPWNDAREHRYVFTLYALDVARLAVDGELTPSAALSALRGHVLEQAELMGRYALSPAILATS